jgi:nucleotide-binding universal stress UspA family protein
MKTKLFRRILVPHDFSVQARKALRVALDLAAAHDGSVTVLHVLAPPISVAELAWSDPAALRSVLRKDLVKEVESANRATRCKVRCVVEVAEPVSAILAAARKADSIVMSTLGQTGLARWLVGSVAEKVVRSSPVPVLTLRVARASAKARRRAPRR